MPLEQSHCLTIAPEQPANPTKFIKTVKHRYRNASSGSRNHQQGPATHAPHYPAPLEARALCDELPALGNKLSGTVASSSLNQRIRHLRQQNRNLPHLSTKSATARKLLALAGESRRKSRLSGRRDQSASRGAPLTQSYSLSNPAFGRRTRSHPS